MDNTRKNKEDIPLPLSDEAAALAQDSNDIEPSDFGEAAESAADSEGEAAALAQDSNDIEPGENATNAESDMEGDPQDATSADAVPCALDKKKDEKLKNLAFGCIPFMLAAIVISLFNMGKVRHPLSFLLLSLGLFELAISAFIRNRAIAKSCDCKNCKKQVRSGKKYALLYLAAAVAMLCVFIYYMVVPQAI